MKRDHIKRQQKFIKAFASNLKKIREEKGLSQEGLANECDMSKSTLQRIEWAKINPTIAIVKSISDALKVEFSELFKL